MKDIISDITFSLRLKFDLNIQQNLLQTDLGSQTSVNEKENLD